MDIFPLLVILMIVLLKRELEKESPESKASGSKVPEK